MVHDVRKSLTYYFVETYWIQNNAHNSVAAMSSEFSLAWNVTALSHHQRISYLIFFLFCQSFRFYWVWCRSLFLYVWLCMFFLVLRILIPKQIFYHRFRNFWFRKCKYFLNIIFFKSSAHQREGGATKVRTLFAIAKESAKEKPFHYGKISSEYILHCF